MSPPASPQPAKHEVAPLSAQAPHVDRAPPPSPPEAPGAAARPPAIPPRDENLTLRAPAGDDVPASDKAVRRVTADVPAPSARAVAASTQASHIGDWEDPIDPDGDSRFDLDRSGNRITIAVPGTAHLLNAEVSRMNAPRMLRAVRGDFVATARLASAPAPSFVASTNAYAPYHGAGFLLWQDRENYVRFELAADVHEGSRRPYANFELRKNGALAVSWGIAITDGSTYLRLEKRGDEVRAAFSADEIHWTHFEPITADFDSNLAVGVVAINSSAKPLTAALENVTITTVSPAAADGKEGADPPPIPEARPSPWPSERSGAPSRLDRPRAPSPHGER